MRDKCRRGRDLRNRNNWSYRGFNWKKNRESKLRDGEKKREVKLSELKKHRDWQKRLKNKRDRRRLQKKRESKLKDRKRFLESKLRG